jgi:hypothetical protein
MLCCVAFACQRLTTAPADTHMAHMSWSWAEMVMERVTRGRAKKVQVSRHSTALVCSEWPPCNMPSFAAVQR